MIKYLDIVIGILSISYYLYLKIVYGGMSFSILFVGIGLMLIIYHFIKNECPHNLDAKLFNASSYQARNKNSLL